jgi:hypothetical protein
MSPDKKVELFYDAYRRHPEARVGTVVQRINRIEKTEQRTAQLRSELDAVSDASAKRMMEAPRETLLDRIMRLMGRR